MEPITCLIYLRVSTEEQAKSGYSLPEQRDRCLAKAKELAGQAPLVPVMIEDAAGGDLLERTGLTQVREFVAEHKPQYFVCLDPDRFSRELFLQLLVTREIEAAGTALVFVQHDYQKTPEGQLFYALRGAVSQYEKAKILDRTKSGLRRKIKEGLVANGTRPFGYRYDKDKDTLGIVPEEAEWVRQIFRWAAEHHGPGVIRDRLNALGVSTVRGGPWRSSTLQGMLRNTTYMGEMRCLRWNTAGYQAQRQLPKDKRTLTPKQRPPEEWQVVPVVPIVDKPLFDSVADTLRHHKRRAKEGAGILSGLARCGVCEQPWHYITDRYYGYVLRCSRRYPRPDALVKTKPCRQPAVNAPKLEGLVWAELTNWFADPAAIAQRLQRQADSSETAATDREQTEKELALLNEQLATKRKEQGGVLMEKVRGHVDAAVADQVMAELKQQIDQLISFVAKAEKRLGALSARKRSTDGLRERLEELQKRIGGNAASVRVAMDRMDRERRQYLLRNTVAQVIIHPGPLVELVPISALAD